MPKKKGSKQLSGKSRAFIGTFAGHKRGYDAYVRSFYGYIAIKKVYDEMGKEAFINQIDYLKEKLVEVSMEENLHVLDCVDIILNNIEKRGMSANDGIFNTIILAGLQIISDDIRERK